MPFLPNLYLLLAFLDKIIQKNVLICAVYIYTWNPNDPCFEWKRSRFGGFNPQNKGQTGSRYIHILMFL